MIGFRALYKVLRVRVRVDWYFELFQQRFPYRIYCHCVIVIVALYIFGLRTAAGNRHRASNAECGHLS